MDQREVTIKLDEKNWRIDENSGFLRASVTATRAGIFVYAGKIRELRTDSEVFAAASLATLEGVPVVVKHPQTAQNPSGMLDSDTARYHAVGSLGKIHKDGDKVKGEVSLWDKKAIAGVLDGSRREVSCGYISEMIHEPGIDSTHGSYDSRQTKIRYNHLALVERGRAGDATVHIDKKEDNTTMNKENQTKTDAAETQASEDTSVTNDPSAPRLYDLVLSLNKRITELAAAVAALGKSDSASARSVEEPEAKADAEETRAKQFNSAVAARVELERQAGKVLGDTERLNSLADDEIKRKVVTAHNDAIDLEGKSDEYIQALYDSAIASQPTNADNAQTAFASTHGRVDSGNAQLTSSEVRAKHMEEASRRWQKPVA